MTVRVGVVFPQAHLSGGVERVVWNLMHYLRTRCDVVFVGNVITPGIPGVHEHHVSRRGRLAALRPLAFRRAAGRAVRQEALDRVVSFGAECPAGDVQWVGSVHRAWLEESGSVRHGIVNVPGTARRLLPRHRVLLDLERRYFADSRPQWVLCTSQREADNLGRLYGVEPARTVVVPNGFDGSRFNPRNRQEWRSAQRVRLGLAPDDVAMLFVANELHRKGFAQTLEAMANLDNRAVSLHVVGRMPLASFDRKIRDLGLGGRVIYHGPTSEVERFYAAADALVLPTQYEPFGLVIIEAMASGLPVLTTSLAGAARAIVPNVSGLVQHDPFDVDELTQLLRLVTDADRREAIGEAAAAAAQPYEWQHVFGQAEQYILGL